MYISTAGICFVLAPIVIPEILDKIMPLNVSRQKTICYYAEYFIDQEKYLIYLVIHTFFGVIITCMVSLAVLPIFVSGIFHAIGLLSIIRLGHYNNCQNFL